VKLSCVVQIEKYEKDERLMKLGLSKTDYPFDYFFAKATSERTALEECNVECEEYDDDNSDDDALSSDSDGELNAASEAVCGSDSICPVPVDMPVTE